VDYLTVRPVLRDRCPVCLSVTLMYCGQTVGRIKMPLGTEVDLGPGGIVLDGDPAPPKEMVQVGLYRAVSTMCFKMS